MVYFELLFRNILNLCFYLLYETVFLSDLWSDFVQNLNLIQLPAVGSLRCLTRTVHSDFFGFSWLLVGKWNVFVRFVLWKSFVELRLVNAILNVLRIINCLRTFGVAGEVHLSCLAQKIYFVIGKSNIFVGLWKIFTNSVTSFFTPFLTTFDDPVQNFVRHLEVSNFWNLLKPCENTGLTIWTIVVAVRL